MISLHRLLWIVLSPMWITWLIYRILKKKENWKRIGERFGYCPKELRNSDVIWLHGASVGESLIAVNLASKLGIKYPNYQFLITTGTEASSKLVEARKSASTIHQFIPLDEYFSIKRFFKNWRPKLGIILESEIWPNLLDVGANYCPLIAANSIMSDKSYNRWMGYRRAARYCLEKFSKIVCQSERDAKKYSMLYCEKEFNDRVINLGNLKFAAPKPLVAPEALVNLQGLCKNRPVMLAASTHPGDEEIICQTHNRLKSEHPDLLTIIVPRHIKRASEIIEIIKSYSLTFAVRSNNKTIKADTDVYLADTMGELGLFFSLAKITIMGGSFKNGGHNPIEPAFFDTHIIFGWDMSNFKDVAKEFLEYKAAVQISNLDELAHESAKLLKTEPAGRSRKVLANHDKIMDNYLDLITQYIK